MEYTVVVGVLTLAEVDVDVDTLLETLVDVEVLVVALDMV